MTIHEKSPHTRVRRVQADDDVSAVISEEASHGWHLRAVGPSLDGHTHLAFVSGTHTSTGARNAP